MRSINFRKFARFAISVCLCASLVASFLCFAPASAEETAVLAPNPTKPELAAEVRSAILMEQSSGQIIFEKAADERMPIASVTKIMTMLLAMEALDAGEITVDTMITCSAYASTMGGSQVYLKEGEQMRFDDIMKAIAVASGNDASVALAEHLAGSEEAFVQKMNLRAVALGMKNTNFINCNGLDDGTQSYCSARDVALMSRELLQHPKIHDYLTIWMDTIRNGEFQLANTNKLIRFYSGANGIKTGSTDAAQYCLSASAKRDDMQLIAVVLGAPATDVRFSTASSLLDHGFANYAVVPIEPNTIDAGKIAVSKGTLENIDLTCADASGVVVPKAKKNAVTHEIDLPKKVSAPIAEGDKIGVINYTIDGQLIASVDLVAEQSSERIGFLQFWGRLIGKFVKMSAK